MVIPPPKRAAPSNPIPYPPYKEDKKEKRFHVVVHEETEHKVLSVKDKLGARVILTRQAGTVERSRWFQAKKQGSDPCVRISP